MKLIKLTPRGFCSGVINAWKIVIETIRNNPDKKIYMLGLFVHNNEMIKMIKANNLIVLDDTNISRFELVKNIQNSKNQILLLSAHGTDQDTISLARQKEMQIVDTTCEFVYKTHDVIYEAIKQKRFIIYFGKLNHPEANATIKISNRIIFIYDYEQLKKLKFFFNLPVTVTNQTTLSLIELNTFFQYIKDNFSDYKIYNEICLATTHRQQAILNLKEKINKLIVVGSERSNNSKQLVKIGETKRIEACHLVNSIYDLKKIKFNKNDIVAVTSGASTPTQLTNEIINYLENWKWN